MKSLTKVLDRNIIPNWRNYQRTIQLGELQSTSTLSMEPTAVLLDKYLNGWETSPSISSAGNLVCAALLAHKSDNEKVLQAAKHIISNQDKASELLIVSARKIVATKSNEELEKSVLNEKLKKLDGVNEDARRRVRMLKYELSNLCNNPISYCELARCYFVLGQCEKAKMAMQTALYLAPSHRYITRCAVRMYVELCDYDMAHSILSHNCWLKKDPWLLASDIAVDRLRDKSISNINTAKKMLESCQYSPFSTSELACSLGMEELEHGNYKKCNRYISQALRDPNDNSLSQAEWLYVYKFNEAPKCDETNLPCVYEADLWNLYSNEQFEDAMSVGLDWCNDMPFDKRAIHSTAWLAGIFNKNYELAIRLLKKYSLISKDTESISNDLVYYTAMSGKYEEASNQLSSINVESFDIDTQICLIATEGLVEFRKGNSERGTACYMKAIEMSKEENQSKLQIKAWLNFLREEIIYHKSVPNEVAIMMERIECGADKELIVLKKDLEDTIKQYSPL